jgi:hypothetical protein
MGELPGSARRGWLAAVPFALAWAVAAAALDGPLAPSSPGVEVAPAPESPPASRPATHHEVQVFDSNELISV